MLNNKKLIDVDIAVLFFISSFSLFHDEISLKYEICNFKEIRTIKKYPYD